MSDEKHNDATPPTLLQRGIAYLSVVAIPAVAFLLSAHAGCGSGLVTMRGINEAYGLQTTEEVVLPGFSVLARLSHGYGARPGYGMSQPRFEEFADALDDGRGFDVIVLGSSHAYRGFDPRVFATAGSSMFNLGSTAQTPTETLFLLNRFGKLPARRAIIEVVPFQLRSGTESAKSARDLALNLPPEFDIVVLASRAGDFDTTRLAASYLVAPRPSFGQVEGGVPLATLSKCWYIPGGYCEWREVALPEQRFGRYDFMPTEDGLAALRQVVARLKSQETEVVMVMAPMPRETLSKARNYDAGVQTVATLASELDVPLLDYTAADTPLAKRLIYPEHFYDDHHLNQSGVEIFNEQLVQDLARISETLD